MARAIPWPCPISYTPRFPAHQKSIGPCTDKHRQDHGRDRGSEPRRERSAVRPEPRTPSFGRGAAIPDQLFCSRPAPPSTGLPPTARSPGSWPLATAGRGWANVRSTMLCRSLGRWPPSSMAGAPLRVREIPCAIYPAAPPPNTRGQPQGHQSAAIAMESSSRRGKTKAQGRDLKSYFSRASVSTNPSAHGSGAVHETLGEGESGNSFGFVIYCSFWFDC
ncbi:hypothetical protein BS78_06G146000 [Paspalum vaginatum]|nr:hypothetical protein BS78_06G146000 [Paspalum vaginatum]